MRNFFNSSAVKPLAVAGAAVALAFAAPAAMADGLADMDISFNNLDFNDEDLLPGLIAMDREDIADLRAEMADARQEIRDAIAEVADARAEAKASPETATMIKAALAAAATTVGDTVGQVFEKVRIELARAETELNDTKAAVGDAEYAETSEAIAAIREELSNMEVALGELMAAMRAA